ncbi:DinB family protein [Lederbergia citri]|uniref:ClbS/DfsB family four-helix bundle protein n=1 Tax=Lederbergia citri TaxID=2833580 RepID=A0A942TIC7_9BACI|nr:DinB family protein [Lederbergia citri]MBS4196642.1 ClbS/DfsB family four-helix bundle protein [Lederbergia citri]
MDDFVGKAELLRRLHYGYKHFNTSIGRLSPEQMEIPGVNGKWSIKEVISHFIAHEQFALSELRFALAGKQYKAEETNIDRFNEAAVAERRDWTVEQVQQSWDDSFREVIAVVKELPDTAFDPWGGFTRILGDTVDGALGNNTYSHYEEHLLTIMPWIEHQSKDN